jgi:hypothetical protein
MVKRGVLICSLVMLLTVCLTFGTSRVAFAQSTSSRGVHAANCGSSALSYTTMDAKGSDSANVSSTVWYDSCLGEYYASAYIFTNSSGFVFQGLIFLFNATSNKNVVWHCYSAGECDTPVLSIGHANIFYIEYMATRGTFYSFTNAEYHTSNSITGWSYVM